MENKKFCAVQKISECKFCDDSVNRTEKDVYGLLEIDFENLKLKSIGTLEKKEKSMIWNIMPEGYQLIDYDELVCKLLREKMRKRKRR